MSLPQGAYSLSSQEVGENKNHAFFYRSGTLIQQGSSDLPAPRHRMCGGN